MRALYKPIAYRTNAQNPENANRITFDTQVIAAIPEKVYCFPHTFGSVKKQRWIGLKIFPLYRQILGSIVVSIPACHAGDRGSIPRRGDRKFFSDYLHN